MTKAHVTALRSIEIGTTHIDVALKFYTEVWQLESAAEAKGTHYLRGTGPYHYILALRPTDKTGVVRVVFDARDRASVDALFGQAKQNGALKLDPPAALKTPGGGYGFGCQDPEGRNYAVVCEVADHADGSDKPDRPRKLSHINLNTRDNDVSFAFLRDAFGFALSDQTGKFRFVRCNADHHSMVLCFSDAPTLNHIAFEMPDIDSIMRGAGRMRDHGYPVEWGPGRHGPGSNVFCYFCGPEEVVIEYTGDMQQIDDSHKVGMPPDWKWPPRRLDRWGVCDFPSARVERAQHLFGFTEDGYRIHG
jgi:catechol 2,3-dioxygenase